MSGILEFWNIEMIDLFYCRALGAESIAQECREEFEELSVRALEFWSFGVAEGLAQRAEGWNKNLSGIENNMNLKIVTRQRITQ